MKQTILLFLSLLSLSPLADARDYITPKDAMKRYDACGIYLKMSPANQLRIARQTDYSREEGIRMCRSVVSRGRKKTLQDAKDWNRWEAGEIRRQREGGGSSYVPPSCTGSNGCGLGEHCYQHQCVGHANRCISDSQCSGGNPCSSNGICER
ncbi:MAG: hypothetical protein EOP11_17625 [Proteobacteria bacterium]|nr:MAG: hypothetical protein EOP11_17625 [Pseudomonadota bacterium]